MKTPMLLVASLFIAAGVASAANVEVTSSTIDIFGDGRQEDVSIVMVAGKLHDDKDSMGCGSGLKHQGRFVVIVTFPEGQAVTTSLWPDDKSIFFYANPWEIAFTDYNHDGITDFNLGQYDSCNGSYYTLFSFKPDGKVFEIGHASLTGYDNSTRNFTVTDEGYSSIIHNSTNGGPTEIFYRWDAASQFFQPYRQTVCYGCVGSDRHREVEMRYNKTTGEFVPVKEIERVLNRKTKNFEVIKERTISP